MQVGVVDLGRRYVSATRSGDETDENWALVQAVDEGVDGDGDPLALDLWWELACAALAACDTDEDFWRLGNDAFGTIWFEEGILERMIDERAATPSLRRLYKVMRRRLRVQGITDGWWFQ